MSPFSFMSFSYSRSGYKETIFLISESVMGVCESRESEMSEHMSEKLVSVLWIVFQVTLYIFTRIIILGYVESAFRLPAVQFFTVITEPFNFMFRISEVLRQYRSRFSRELFDKYQKYSLNVLMILL